ncbi:hypothetical protein C8J31_11682 [Rhizobium sp. PP-CC-2G-626]|nr:hypothetical protein C8J31_11682 [Rhizobium sp. PP-CC-2G-626]
MAALFIQSRELKAQREELNETQGLLTKQIEVSERQAEAAYAQVEAAVQQAKEAKASMELQREQAHYLKSVEELRDQKARTDRTLQFFREFCSREMALARNEASLFVKDHRALELHGNEFDSTLERMSVPVWIVARFFQSLWVHIKNHSVDNASTSELFGSIFIWWHVNYLSTALYEGWKITSDLQDFEGWLRSSVDPSEFERWEYEAQADMERIERVKIPRTTDDLDPNATA